MLAGVRGDFEPDEEQETHGFRVAGIPGLFLVLGDMNYDGEVNDLDVDPFVHAVINDPFNVRGDMNGDGVVTGLDVDPFVAALVGGRSPGGARRGPQVGVRPSTPPSAATAERSTGRAQCQHYPLRR